MYAFTNILRSRGPALKKERKKKERRKKERKKEREEKSLFLFKDVSASQTSRKSVHGKHINEALPGGTRFNGFCPVPIT